MTWQKGQSGNPNGRPKEVEEVKELARRHCVMAIERLVFWAESDNAKASVIAAQALLDRGFGKPSQEMVHKGDGLKLIISKRIQTDGNA